MPPCSSTEHQPHRILKMCGLAIVALLVSSKTRSTAVNGPERELRRRFGRSDVADPDAQKSGAIPIALSLERFELVDRVAQQLRRHDRALLVEVAEAGEDGRHLLPLD